MKNAVVPSFSSYQNQQQKNNLTKSNSPSNMIGPPPALQQQSQLAVKSMVAQPARRTIRQQQQQQNSPPNRSYYRHSEFHNINNVPIMGYAAVPTGLRFNNNNNANNNVQTKTGINNKFANITNNTNQANLTHVAGRVSSINNTIYPHKSIVMARHGETMNVKDR